MITIGWNTQAEINPGIYDMLGSTDFCGINNMPEIDVLGEIKMEVNTLNAMETVNAENS